MIFTPRGVFKLSPFLRLQSICFYSDVCLFLFYQDDNEDYHHIQYPYAYWKDDLVKKWHNDRHLYIFSQSRF